MALEEYLAVYDSTARKPGGVTVLVPREIAALGKDYPPALAELKKRRDQAKAKAMESAANADAALEYAAISSALGDSGAALKLWEQFPAGDPRRRALGGQVYVTLVEKKRYAEALEARSLESMIRFMEVYERTFASAENAGSRYFRIVLESRARDIEVLAGAGRISDALELRDRLLKIDSSEATQEMVMAHLKRAGYVAPATARN
jgi:tetratricopeptide (TPR) repeat protein